MCTKRDRKFLQEVGTINYNAVRLPSSQHNGRKGKNGRTRKKAKKKANTSDKFRDIQWLAKKALESLWNWLPS